MLTWSVYTVVLMRKTHNSVKINDPNYKTKICTEKWEEWGKCKLASYSSEGKFSTIFYKCVHTRT